VGTQNEIRSISYNGGLIGLGIKTASEVANAIKSILAYAKLSLIPVQKGYWVTKSDNPALFQTLLLENADPYE
jgi:ribosomal protein S5